MKRCSEDVCVTPQPKRPFVSPDAESSRRSQTMYGNRGQRLTTNDALAYLQKVKEIFQDRRDIYDGFLEVMKDFKSQRINSPGVIARVKELFRGHRDLILGFNTFLPKGFEITLPPDDGPPLPKKPVNFEEAISFVSKIKTRCQGDGGHVYKSFLSILNMYKKESNSISEVYKEVAVILHGYPDLIEEFSQFLPDAAAVCKPHDQKQGPMTTARLAHVEKKAIFSNADCNVSVERPDCEKSVLKFHKEQHRRVEKEQEYNDGDTLHNCAPAVDCAADRFLQGCNGAVNNGSSWNDDENMPRPTKENLDKGRDNDWVDRYKDQDKRERDKPDRGTTVSSQEMVGQKTFSYSTKDKYMSKCIQELDLSNCERCTPSYRLLPKNYPIPLVSQRTKIGAEVLNDHWVSVTSGSEDYSFKHMRKNQYEESLFRCEDDRFELDMLLESVNVAIKLVEELLDKINDNAIKSEPPICIEDHFTALNRRCIEKLYGEHGVDVMDVLRKNAPLALPVILTRLKQKQEEWARCRVDFNKVWAEIYAKNYHKSLDHRSFYFKQQDTKSLSTRALLAEIKELCEKQNKGDHVLLSVAAGSRQPIIPHMEFSYPDPDIHEDLYQLIKHSCREVCATEQLDKVMKIWTEFLEPMLGVPSRPQGAGDTDGVMKDKLSNSYYSDVKDDDNGSYAATAVTNQNQSTLSANGDDSTPSEQSTPSRVCLADNMVKDDGSHRADCNGTLNGIPHHGDMQVKTNSGDDARETPGKDNAESSSGGCTNLTRLVDITAEGVLEKHRSDDSEGKNCVRTIPSSSRIAPEGIRSQECPEPSIPTKREEGVISLDVDMEDNFGHWNSDTQIAHSTKDATAGRHYESAYGVEKHEQAGGENVAVADNCEESDCRYPGVSRDAFQNVVSSETYAGDAEGCSPGKLDEDGKCDGNENKVKNEGNTGMTDAHDTEGDRALFPCSEDLLLTSRPITRLVPSTLQDKKNDSHIFYGNDSFYVLFRQHQTLYERIQKAKLYSSSAENRWRVLNDMNQTDSYARFMTALYSLVDGSSDNARFEDDCRFIVGTQCHVLFTLDKLIYKLLKQLQTIATDEVDNRLLQLYAYEKSRDPARFSDVVYHENAGVILPDENVYRIECSSATMRLSVQLMDCAHDKPEVPAVSMEPQFAAYLHNDVLSVVLEGMEKPGLYLKRNKRKNAKGDEASAFFEVMEGVMIINRLECKINCSTSKAGYVMDTEDFFFRMKKQRRPLYHLPLNDHASNGSSRRVRRICKLIKAIS